MLLVYQKRSGGDGGSWTHVHTMTENVSTRCVEFLWFKYSRYENPKIRECRFSIRLSRFVFAPKIRKSILNE